MEPPFDLTAPVVQTLWGVSLLCFHESLFSASSAMLIAFHWNASLTFLSILGHDCSCVPKTYLLNEYCWANEVRPSSEALVLIKPLIPFVRWISCSKCKKKKKKPMWSMLFCRLNSWIEKNKAWRVIYFHWRFAVWFRKESAWSTLVTMTTGRPDYRLELQFSSTACVLPHHIFSVTSWFLF